MERVKTLINKLQQQSEANETARQLLYTVQLLAAELSHQQETEQVGKVSVIMPGFHVVQEHLTNELEIELIEKKEEPVIEEVAESEIIEEVIEVAPEPIVEEQSVEEPEIIAEETKPVEPVLTPKPEKITHTLLVDEADEIPTLSMRGAEINDIVQQTSQSLNEQLKEDKKEVAHTLVDAPVKDLRKAIGINDKYVFINELFSGDEATYERSIKTINNFSVYPEAEQWIKRELYTKLCWLDNNKTVENFYNIVRRRFS